MPSTLLRGTRVVVAGAGLAGLAAARDLEADGASVSVIEARDRVGGRVHTLRDGFAARQHAEAGADLIEGGQHHVLELAKALGLETFRILKGGWGFYGRNAGGRRRVQSAPQTFEQAARHLEQEINDYKLAQQRWESAVAGAIGRTSVAEWLSAVDADEGLASGVRGLRGFFLADPEDLSLLVLVDQFASGNTPGEGKMFRIRGGNDRLPRAMASALAGRLRLGTVLRKVLQRKSGLVVTVEESGARRQMPADYLVAALPASTLKDVRFEPGLPDDQRRAISQLRYGAATRMVLQFAKPYWRRRGRRRAYGTDLPIGAVWDGTEDQRASPAMLLLLAGGRASNELQEIVSVEGDRGVLERLAWLGKPARLLSSRVVTWEHDSWSHGGYAIFDSHFDPALRPWLSRPAGRVVFAGEHTSHEWQGYMNGAIESGKRAAAEIRAMVREARR
jgi:monoamine oxidase